MANISSAFGTITIECDNAKGLEELEKCFEISESWDYYTAVEEAFAEIETIAKYAVKGYFYGCGRWSYQTNIERLFDWLSNQKEKLNWKLLEDSNFSITFDYTDEECGMQFIYKATYQLIHKAGNPLPEGITMIDKKYEDYEYNLVNLTTIAGYNFWGEFEVRFGSNNCLDDNDIFSSLSSEKESIEEYFHEPLGKILREHGYSDLIALYNREALKCGKATI